MWQCKPVVGRGTARHSSYKSHGPVLVRKRLVGRGGGEKRMGGVLSIRRDMCICICFLGCFLARLPHKVKPQYVAHTAFSKFWDIEHFSHTAFLLCQTIMSNLLVFVRKQKVFMFIHNPYLNVFQLILNFLLCSWCYHAVDTYCTYCIFFYFVKVLFFPKNTLLKIFLKNQFYHLIEHTS